VKRDPATDELSFYALARTYLHTYLTINRRASVKTVEAYRIALECFISYLNLTGVARDGISFDHFTRANLTAWIEWMTTEKQYAARTVTLRISAIKAFLAYAAVEDITLVTLHQQIAGIKAPIIAKSAITYLTPIQTKAILAAHSGKTMKSRRNRMLLILLYETAARVSELAGLTIDDIQLNTPARITLRGKRSKTRVVPLSTGTVAHLRVYLEEFHPEGKRQAGQPLFYSQRDQQLRGLSVDSIAGILKSAGAIARESEPTVPTNLHCHILRKTKAMDLYQQGIPLPIIMRLLGHENTSTTNAFYAFATLDMMKAAIDAATPTPQPNSAPAREIISSLLSLK